MTDPLRREATEAGDHAVPPSCPACGISSKVVPIVYGYPSDAMFEAARRGEILCGGCVVDRNSPGWYCQGCRGEFRAQSADAGAAIGGSAFLRRRRV